MPTLIEQQVTYNKDIAIPLERVLPGEDVFFPFISLWLERMNFLAKCAADNEKSDLFIVSEKDIERNERGLAIIRNSALIPISSLHIGQSMIFQLKRRFESPVAKIKVSHVL